MITQTFRRRVFISAAFLLLAGSAIAQTHSVAARSHDQLVRNLRRHVHHVFLIYQENRSFDSYFGSFPGTDNLATAEARSHGFRQWDSIGNTWITPFPLRAADTLDADHSREALITKSNHGHMDHFISWEENKGHKPGANLQAAHQRAMLTMAHEDCHTIPFLWMYAHRFALYDHIFQAMYGPSTPGNIDVIAGGQAGQTQAARHPGETTKSYDTPGEPVDTSIAPAFPPYASSKQASGQKQLDQTYATLMLSLKGRDAGDAKVDIGDVKDDIGALMRLNHQAIPWAWYQEGFGDGRGNDHPAYIAHHNAPQYFGYIRQSPAMWNGEHDLLDFFSVMHNRQLPAKSVVFIKGGRLNPFGWKPADARAAKFLGDDDHPGYSDSQLSESLVAKVVNAVARSPYWSDSAIIILWDDSDGVYDHVPPPQFEICPDKNPCGDGPRVPLILISPWARSEGVVKDAGDHASFARLLDVLFDLPPLASLPDEKPYLPEGPRDSLPQVTDLLGGFDPMRLSGAKHPIAASQAEIPDTVVDHFPPAMSCTQTGVEPVMIPGAATKPPKDFTNALP